MLSQIFYYFIFFWAFSSTDSSFCQPHHQTWPFSTLHLCESYIHILNRILYSINVLYAGKIPNFLIHPSFLFSFNLDNSILSGCRATDCVQKIMTRPLNAKGRWSNGDVVRALFLFCCPSKTRSISKFCFSLTDLSWCQVRLHDERQLCFICFPPRLTWFTCFLLHRHRQLKQLPWVWWTDITFRSPGVGKCIRTAFTAVK